MGFMPFFMVYGYEAILPTDLEYGALRVRAYDDQGNQASLEDVMDQLEEARDVALLHSAKVLASLTTIPPLPCAGSGIQRQVPSALPQIGQQGPPQANTTMGSRPVRRRRSTLT
jgi:hypothetical protein